MPGTMTWDLPLCSTTMGVAHEESSAQPRASVPCRCFSRATTNDFFVVPVNDGRVAVKGRGTAFAMTMFGVHLAKVFFPEQLTRTVQQYRPYKPKNATVLAIGDRQCQGQAAGDMTGSSGVAFCRSAAKEGCRWPGHGQNSEVVIVGQCEIVVSTWTNEAGFTDRHKGSRCKRTAGRPKRRGGMPLAGQRPLPADVLFFVRFDRRLGIWCDAGC